MSLPEEQSPLEEPLSPIGRKQLGLAASFVTPSPKNGNKDGNGFIDEVINKRKPSSTMVCHTQKPIITRAIYKKGITLKNHFLSKALLRKLLNMIHIKQYTTLKV